MILTLMVLATLVSALVAMGALGGEAALRAAGRPVRVVWLVALVGTVILVALAPLRAPGPQLRTVTAPAPGGADKGMAQSVVLIPDAHTPVELLAVLREAVAWPLRAVAPATGAGSDRVLALGWLAGTAGVLLLGAATLLRYRATRRRWPLRTVAGWPVRVAPAAGPAVLGVLRPEVVVPDWLLATPPEAQRLVLIHEREHVSARDPLVLMAGWLTVALMPWNALAWWMLARLRLAVELDCDARVLGHGVESRAYGSVLIDMAGRGSGLPLGMPAMAGARSTLERRILAMSTRIERYAPARAAGFGALGALALLAACETRMPTAVEIEEMDVAAAEAQAVKLQLLPVDGSILYIVDGMPVSAADARSVAADRIGHVEVVRGEGDGGARILIRTRDDAQLGTGELAVVTDPASRVRVLRLEAEGDGADQSPRVLERRLSREGAAMTNFPGLVLIDGVITESGMRGLRPDAIERVEVIKGPDAAQQYDDPRAKHGVIRITTKR